ncbi:ubiquitin-conjugating enzyme/RWD-like protein [Cokeromyces recurvatus]|uniref:ubiquitin-conjugating enzyme/RWD-like protein n=1 Tax=Cokeromyces recurvatus TaxID=90255 RepID=UPI00221F56A4|nr:ubiquitin-conjugating enzyme/RWD-like protein [Cokeromyces recurvatus]KAI7903723.1 ubiquitin-conjugating enzyme/RWD-like protein [Cokeromyces recurvatus]
MTDFLEEQANELEALASIYPDEFEAISDKEFRIAVYPEEQDEENPRGLSLHVTYTPNYPEELPEYEIETIQGDIPDNYYKKIKEAVKTAAEDSIGMAMIFGMVMCMKEELDNIKLDAKRIEEEIANEKRRKEEEAEQAKFHGTKVTIESFMEWKKKFDAEMFEKDEALKAQKAKELKGKLTGRQLFEQDRSLALSDAKYMDEGDDSVDVSQFEKEERPGALDENQNEDDENAVWKRFDNEE